MELWLGTDTNKIRLPVPPSTVGVNREANIETSNVIKLGEVSVFNGMKLKTTEISSFFPNSKYSFVEFTDFKKPYEYSDIIQKWLYEGTVLRFTVTDTPTNMLCTINSFNTVEQDGTRDLYYTLSLTEYKAITIPKEIKNNTSSNNATRPTTQTTTSKQKTHKVVKGDSLWAIAQKYYGKGSLYPKIKEANSSKYPSLKTSNIIYTSMTLVIP